MFRRLLVALAALATFAGAAPAQAYWEFGHQTVANIAWANIKPRTRVAIRRLLASQKLLDTPTCPTGTLADGAVWADCIKPLKDADGKSRFGYAYNWHFQDVDVCKPFDVDTPCADGNCASVQIVRDMKILRDRHASRLERLQALLFLTHIVGDLHQPLHAGEKGDKGGNDVKATYGSYAGAKLNLHSIWDGLLAERAITTGPSLVRRYPAATRARVAAGEVLDWSRESWKVAHDSVYGSVMKDPCAPTPERVVVDEATIQKLIPIARLEVERGGLRLAKLLDRAFA